MDFFEPSLVLNFVITVVQHRTPALSKGKLGTPVSNSSSQTSFSTYLSVETASVAFLFNVPVEGVKYSFSQTKI